MTAGPTSQKTPVRSAVTAHASERSCPSRFESKIKTLAVVSSRPPSDSSQSNQRSPNTPDATRSPPQPASVSDLPLVAKVKRSAAAPAIPASVATAPKAMRLAPVAAKVKTSAPAAMEASTTDATPTSKGTAAAAIVIEIPSSPDYSDGSSRKKERKRSAPPLDLDDEIEMWTPREKRRFEEDCQILAGDPLAAAEMAPATAGNDDIEIVAERGKVACRDYPHPRSACARNPFNTTPHERHCVKCFCYVCDVAAPCVYWKGTGGHCHASEKDKKWETMRFLSRKQKK